MCPPIIKAQRTEPLMNTHLATLVKHVAELREASLEACHYIKEFHLWRICSLGRWYKCAFECPGMADPNRKLAC
jgi:hypothetical protein